MKRRRFSQERHPLLGEPQHLRQARRQAPDTLGVLSGVVVPELRRLRQPVQHLLARFLQLARPLLHALLELGVLFPQLRMEEARADQIADAQPDLGGAQRLRQEVRGAEGQRPPPRIRRGIAGGHENRDVIPLREPVPEVFQELEPVEPGHHQVEEHQVRPDLVEQRGRFAGVGVLDQGPVPFRLQHVVQEPEIRWLVVHQQDAGVAGASITKACIRMAQHHFS